MAGFIKSNFEIKIIILYILSQVEEPLTFDELSHIALCDEDINYFLLKQSVEELLEPENIQIVEQSYEITQRGRDNLESFRSKLPLSIKTLCDVGLEKIQDEQNNRKYVKSQLIENPDTTVLVHLTLLDPNGILMELKLIATSKKEGKAMVEGFHENPSQFFHEVMGTVRGFAGLT